MDIYSLKQPQNINIKVKIKQHRIGKKKTWKKVAWNISATSSVKHQWLQLSVWKYLIFNAIGEGHLCLLKGFLFLIFTDYISFSFYMKYIWKICCWNFFGCNFLSAHTIQTVPKYIWMQHWIYVIAFILSVGQLVVQLYLHQEWSINLVWF